jgi:hypothetical protein
MGELVVERFIDILEKRYIEYGGVSTRPTVAPGPRKRCRGSELINKTKA